MRLRRSAVVATLAAVLAGCSAPDQAPTVAATPAPAASPAPDAWVDQVCAAGVTVATPAVATPAITGTDLVTLQKTISGYLGGVVTGVQQGRTQLDAAGPSPIAGGDAAVARARSVLDGLERSVTDARAQVDRSDPRNPATFATTLRQVESSLRATKAPDALRDVLAVPGFAAAAGRSATCGQLQSLAARVPG